MPVGTYFCSYFDVIPPTPQIILSAADLNFIFLSHNVSDSGYLSQIYEDTNQNWLFANEAAITLTI